MLTRLRWRTRILLGVLALVTVAVPVAWASHTFADVPTANPHHNDITAIRNAGITGGCNPPTNNLYCPADAVRRDQMASFLSRGLPRVAQSRTLLRTTPTSNRSDGLTGQVTINVPGNGGTQFVKVDAVVVIAGDGTACPCYTSFSLGESGAETYTGFDQMTTNSFEQHTRHISGVFAASAGNHTYTFRLGQNENTSFSLSNLVLTATTQTFGSTGTSTLSTDAQPSAAITAGNRP